MIAISESEIDSDHQEPKRRRILTRNQLQGLVANNTINTISRYELEPSPEEQSTQLTDINSTLSQNVQALSSFDDLGRPTSASNHLIHIYIESVNKESDYNEDQTQNSQLTPSKQTMLIPQLVTIDNVINNCSQNEPSVKKSSIRITHNKALTSEHNFFFKLNKFKF